MTSLVDKSSAEEASEALAKEIKEMQIRHQAALAELKASKAIVAEHLINLGAINFSSGGKPLESPAPERVPLQEVALFSEDSTQEIVLADGVIHPTEFSTSLDLFHVIVTVPQDYSMQHYTTASAHLPLQMVVVIII